MVYCSHRAAWNPGQGDRSTRDRGPTHLQQQLEQVNERAEGREVGGLDHFDVICRRASRTAC
jgi:hypothetical protein